MNFFIQILLIVTLCAIPSAAETFVVTKEQDDNGPCTPDDCALREATIAANALPGPDIIEIPGGTYQLSLVGPVEEEYSLTGDLDLLESVEIRGDVLNPVMIIGDGTDRVMELGTLGQTYVVSHVILTGGNAVSSGGGLRSTGLYFTLRDSAIIGNTTQFGDGGGLFFAAARMATIENCTFVDNHAPNGRGGGIRASVVRVSSFVDFINSTVSGNSAQSGGGIYLFGSANFDLVNLTIADNETPNIFGDGLVGDLTNRTTVFNSIFSNNSCAVISGIIHSNGHNMEGPTSTCFFPIDGDQMGVPDIGLGPLTNNGGPTQTHALLEGSPALDAALEADCPTTDQRGFARPGDGDRDGIARCDIGAFEAGFPSLTAVPTLNWQGILALLALLIGAGLGVLRRGRPSDAQCVTPE